MPVAERDGSVLVDVSRTATNDAAEAVYGVGNLAVDGHTSVPTWMGAGVGEGTGPGGPGVGAGAGS